MLYVYTLMHCVKIVRNELVYSLCFMFGRENCRTPFKSLDSKAKAYTLSMSFEIFITLLSCSQSIETNVGKDMNENEVHNHSSKCIFIRTA